jgi:hypothetical protein
VRVAAATCLRYSLVPRNICPRELARAGMNHPKQPRLSTALASALLALALAGCATGGGGPEPAAGPSSPPAFQAHDIVGRWSFAVYLREEDRARTELEAAKHCDKPTEITPGPTGGVMMLLGARDKPEELHVKGAGGKTYIGPDGPPGGWLDLEVISYDSRALTMRWADPKVRDKYGTMVYVRCPPEGAKPKAEPKRKIKPKSKPKPKRT